MNVPNRLTLLRVALIPVFVALMTLEGAACQIASAAVFVAASLTDLLDGYYARKHGLVTNFGILMDPVADKLLVMTALVGLVAQGRVHYAIAMLLLAREFFISGVRMVAAARGVVIAAGKTGKLKTATQMAGLTAALLGTGGLTSLRFLSLPAAILLWASVALSVISCVEYVVNNKEVFKE